MAEMVITVVSAMNIPRAGRGTRLRKFYFLFPRKFRAAAIEYTGTKSDDHDHLVPVKGLGV
jgi:hypothetical protein